MTRDRITPVILEAERGEWTQEAVYRDDGQGLLTTWIWKVRPRQHSEALSGIVTESVCGVWMLTPFMKMDSVGGGRVGWVLEGPGRVVVWPPAWIGPGQFGGLAGYLEGDVHEEVARLGSEAVLAVDSLAREMGVVAEMENEGRAEEERAACGPWGNVFN